MFDVGENNWILDPDATTILADDVPARVAKKLGLNAEVSMTGTPTLKAMQLEFWPDYFNRFTGTELATQTKMLGGKPAPSKQKLVEWLTNYFQKQVGDFFSN